MQCDQGTGARTLGARGGLPPRDFLRSTGWGVASGTEHLLSGFRALILQGLLADVPRNLCIDDMPPERNGFHAAG